MASTGVRVVRLPDGTHWLVSRGRGHQITGTNLLRWATVMYGAPVEQAAADWEPDVIAFEVFGGPGEIEKVVRGEKADPFGVWLVSVSTPQVELTPEEAAFLGSDPDSPVDLTTGDDAVSVRLPTLSVAPPPNPQAADPNAPDLAAQIRGATGDRTPGLALPDIPVYVSPTQPVPATEEEPEPAPSNEGPFDRPGADAPVHDGPFNRPGAAAPVHTDIPLSRPGASAPVHTDGPYSRPAPSGPYSRPTPAQPYNRPARTSGYAAVTQTTNPLPPPRYPLLRGFLTRSRQPLDWLDRIEGR